MKTAQVWAVLALLMVSTLLLGLWLQGDDAVPVTSAPAVAPQSAGASVASTGPVEMLPGEIAPSPSLAATDTALPEVPALAADATQSMSNAREHGDARQPALQRDVPRDMPSAQELADPEAYQRYEARQNQRLHKAYVNAADTEIPRLQKDIERARQAGLSPEQIAEGEEKLRRIQAMRDQLQAAGAAAP